MADWLRPVFQRSRSAIPSVPTNERSGGDDGQDTEDVTIRRPSSRVSSYLGFRLSPSSPSFPDKFPDKFPKFKNVETVSQPSADHMAETLKVAMMTRSSLEPLPIEYNSCLLHLLEAFHDMTEQLNAKEQAIEELKENHTRNIKEFEELASQWEEKERGYKADIKNLEVFLSKTEGGMQNVMVSRSNSAVHGSRRAAVAIGLGIRKMKGDTARGIRKREDKPASSRNPPERLRTSTDSAIKDREAQDRIVVGCSRSHQTLAREQSKAANQATDNTFSSDDDPPTQDDGQNTIMNIPTSGVRASQLKELERQESIKQFGVAFESSDSSESELSHNRERPLPNIVFSPEQTAKALRNPGEAMMGSYPNTKRTSTSGLTVPRQQRFSFHPGDDNEVLPQGNDREVVRGRPSGKSQNTIEKSERSTTPSSRTSFARRNSTSLISRTRSGSTVQGQMTDLRPSTQGEPLRREDSMNSIITAIRNNSGRSSGHGSQHSNHTERPRLDRNKPNSSEAVTAAVAASRAVTGQAQRKTSQDNKSMGKGSNKSISDGKGGSNERSVRGSQAVASNQGRRSSEADNGSAKGGT